MGPFWDRIGRGTAGPAEAVFLGLGALVLGLFLTYALLRRLARLASKHENPKIARPRVFRLTFCFVVASIALGSFLFFHATLAPDVRSKTLAYEVSQVFLILFAAYPLFELVLGFLADFLPQSRGRSPLAAIFKDLIRALVLIPLCFLAFRFSFPEADLGALLTTSAIASVVIGLALQDSLSNIFAGLMLTIDRPFKPGDWIDVDGQEAKVLDSNWRSTRVITRDDDVIYVPNSKMAQSNIVNFTDPDPDHVCRRKVVLEYGAPPNRVRSVLVAAMLQVDGVLPTPEPDVYVQEFEESGVAYELWFWIKDYDARLRIESDLMRSVWYRLKREGIGIPYPVREVHLRRERPPQLPEETLTLLRKVDILAPLSEEDLLLLAGDLGAQLFAAGEAICRQGDPGATFYIIRSGSVSVRVKGDDGVEAEVAKLGPGQYFGEMSLLTGDPRNSTCEAVEDSELLGLDRESFGVLLRNNPSVAQSMSAILASRSQETQVRLASERETKIRQRPQESPAQTKILQKIMALFGRKR